MSEDFTTVLAQFLDKKQISPTDLGVNSFRTPRESNNTITVHTSNKSNIKSLVSYENHENHSPESLKSPVDEVSSAEKDSPIHNTVVNDLEAELTHHPNDCNTEHQEDGGQVECRADGLGEAFAFFFSKVFDQTYEDSIRRLTHYQRLAEELEVKIQKTYEEMEQDLRKAKKRKHAALELVENLSKKVSIAAVTEESYHLADDAEQE